MIIFNALQTSLSGGIGRYSYELSKQLYLLKKIPIKIVIREEDKELFNFADDYDLIIAKDIKDSKSRNYYEQIILPRMINKRYPNAIIHYPDTMAPLFSKNKVVITVHDISFRALENIFTWKTKVWKNLITKFSISKASAIIADTNFTKSEVVKYYPKADEKKINVVHCGFNNFSGESISLDEVGESIKNLKSPYILTVSTISPRKNIDGLINAFNKIAHLIPHNLVVAGKNGWLYEEVHKLVRELKLQDRVIFTGGINDNELKYLYKNSDIFIYPSFYEGFGLPPLEAMSYGIPNIVSNTTSIPEVVADAAEMFNPNSVEDISNKLLKVINDEGLREQLIERGYSQIKKFSWKKCAEDLMEIYKKFI